MAEWSKAVSLSLPARDNTCHSFTETFPLFVSSANLFLGGFSPSISRSKTMTNNDSRAHQVFLTIHESGAGSNPALFNK